MSEKRFTPKCNFQKCQFISHIKDNENQVVLDINGIVDLLNEQQELIEELHISDNMGWGRAEKFEKELKQKKIYIKLLEYKVQKFKEMNGEQQATISALKEVNGQLKHYKLYEDNKRLQTIIADLKDDKNQLHKVISKLRQEVAELKTRNSVLSSKLNQIPKSIKEVWLDE